MPRAEQDKSHDQTVIALHDVVFQWPGASRPTIQIDSLAVSTGERVFLYGPSGSGKSTLLGLIAGIHSPSKGSVNILGQNLADMSRSKRDRWRADHVGYIFQLFNLLPYLSLIENVTLACQFSVRRTHRIVGDSPDKKLSSADEAKRLLCALGLPETLLTASVSNLSVGQQQRVAAARALMGQPDIVIADEPTSALDSDAREAFIRLLLEQTEQKSRPEVNDEANPPASKSAVLFVSHDASLASYFDRQISLAEINRV